MAISATCGHGWGRLPNDDGRTDPRLHARGGCARTFLDCTIDHSWTSNVEVFNLSSGHPITIRAFAEGWWKEWEAKGNLLFGAVPYRSGEVMRYVAGGNVLRVGSCFHSALMGQ